jgi:hypothetical protein
VSRSLLRRLGHALVNLAGPEPAPEPTLDDLEAVRRVRDVAVAQFLEAGEARRAAERALVAERCHHEALQGLVPRPSMTK